MLACLLPVGLALTSGTASATLMAEYLIVVGGDFEVVSSAVGPCVDFGSDGTVRKCTIETVADCQEIADYPLVVNAKSPGKSDWKRGSAKRSSMRSSRAIPGVRDGEP